MKILKFFLILLFCLIFLVTFRVKVWANPDIQVNFRLYEGTYNRQPLKKTSVLTTYQLKPLFSGTMILDIDISGEKKEIKKIFNLSDLKLLTQVKWGWKEGAKKKQFQAITFDGRKFILQLGQLKEKNNFSLQVMEKGKEKRQKLLEVEIILPQEKTSIFGFENSRGKPFFLSLQRDKDKKIPGKEPLLVYEIKRPRLIKKVKPVYPEKAIQKGISGKVIVECTTDIYGRVKKVEVKKGSPLLSTAAIDAVKQWVYEPYILNKIPKPVKFTVVVSFNLHDDKAKKLDLEVIKEKNKEKKFTPQQLIQNLKKRTHTGELMNFNFKDADLANIISFFSKITGLDMTMEKGIKGTVSCKFEQVPWDKALSSFLNDNHLELILEQGKLIIRKQKR